MTHSWGLYTYYTIKRDECQEKNDMGCIFFIFRGRRKKDLTNGEKYATLY